MQVKDLVLELPLNLKKKPKKRPLSAIKKIVVHCTDWEITPQELAKYDIEPNHISSTGCPSISYHYLVEPDGTVERTAPEEWVTWHAGNYNDESIAVSLVYKTDPLFEQGKKKVPAADRIPTAEMMDSLKKLLPNLCLQFGISPLNVVGHRELEGTGWVWVKEHKALRKSCPGMWVNLDQLRRDVASSLQTTMKAGGFYAGKVDGLWGPLSEKAFVALRATLN
jgi:N-acetylmuramoyl-L-alanine amidase